MFNPAGIHGHHHHHHGHFHHFHPRPNFGPRVVVPVDPKVSFFALATVLAIKALALGIVGVATMNPVAAIVGFTIFGITAAAITIGAIACLNDSKH